MTPAEISEKVITLTNEANTMGDLNEMLSVIAYTVGGMICHFDADERSQMLIGLTKMMGDGFMRTSKCIGEPTNIEMVVGERY